MQESLSVTTPITITLPDQSTRQYPQFTTGEAIAADIGPGLAKAALAVSVNDHLVDLSTPIDSDATIRFITSRDPEGLEVIRHSTAHLLAHAVKHLFPEAQVTIGPVIEHGFYYDFAFERAFTPEDLEAIEQKMQEIVKAAHPLRRFYLERDEAVEFFRKQGEEYKAQIIEAIPANEKLSLYEQGDFTDLCRGPHVPNTDRLGVFKLQKVAGAYWRGDSKNEMLQRIYGTAFADQKSLKAHLHRLEEAQKRDHRKLGKHLHLFHFQEEAPGMVFWHAGGWTIYREVETLIRELLHREGYQEVRTPTVLSLNFWERSGHWEKFQDEMFSFEAEDHHFALKPMNCPGHIQIFNQKVTSYRDLPLRMSEFGSCFRNEPSGAMHGLMRCRNFVQDDAHIFCTPDQVQDEVTRLIDLIFEVYKIFGFEQIIIKLSTRPEKRIGSDEIWDQAEKALAQALDQREVEWALCEGEGAFYGPKIEFALKDSLDRIWQCGTVQLDFNLPERLDAHYVSKENNHLTPIMIHRALLGSIERFIGILIEHYAGKLPLWLAPVQLSILTITDRQNEFAQKIAEKLKNEGIRCQTDLRNEKIGFKIREHTLMRVPYLAVLGDQELESGQVSLRARSGENLGMWRVDQLIEELQQEIELKAIMSDGGSRDQ